MPRYVILRHRMPPESPRASHWDLMLETGETLRTWALTDEPQANLVVSAEALCDHRKHYLDYEGPVSGGRGSVERWDSGTYCWLEETARRLVAALTPDRMAADRLILEHQGGQRWRVCFSSVRSAE